MYYLTESRLSILKLYCNVNEIYVFLTEFPHVSSSFMYFIAYHSYAPSEVYVVSIGISY